MNLLSANKIENEGVEAIKSSIGPEGAKALAEAIKSGHCKNLQKLKLGYNDIRNEGAKALAEAINPVIVKISKN